MRIDSYTYSNIGGRSVNEDTVLFMQKENAFVAVVADGLGGHGFGDQASQKAVEVFSEWFQHSKEYCKETIHEACCKMNRSILDMQTGGKQMKSTFASVLFDGNTLYFIHTGDSRIYMFRNGEIVHQSKDHSMSQYAVMTGEITPDKIRFHADRNRVLRVLGEPEETFKPEINVSELVPQGNDAFLLCSDGFWEYVLEKQMTADLNKTETAEKWVEAMAKRMKWKFIHNQDNNSAVAVRITEE